MKRILFAAAMCAATLCSSALAADVGVSVSVGQPGFYGRLDIGDFPQPRVIYAQPRAVTVVPVSRPPIYLRVPPGHAKHWRSHCREYNACDERVYFVQDDWYNREYLPRYQARHGERHDDDYGDRGDRHEGHGKGHQDHGPQDHGHGHDH